jgi:hypothetical protein
LLHNHGTSGNGSGGNSARAGYVAVKTEFIMDDNNCLLRGPQREGLTGVKWK